MSRKHLASRWYGRGRTVLVCRCEGWQGDPSQTVREQRLAHRVHRVEMGEEVKPLAPSRSERLAAAEAAVARVRALSERLGATDPGLRDEILKALDGTETPA